VKICVLFLHHEACALTRFHFALLSNQNAGDALLEIVPVSFPEYQSCSLLPGTWIAERAAQFRSNPSDVFHRFHRYRLSNTHRSEGARARFPRMMAA
jgi:hypothetical protein